MKRAVAILALLGTLVAGVSAIQAFVAVGRDPAYHSRLSAGTAALLAALLAAAASILFGSRPGRAGLLILLCAAIGIVAINLFYINTYYVFAAPFWLAAAVLALVDWAAQPRASRER